jgi:hypothetical protein
VVPLYSVTYLLGVDPFGPAAARCCCCCCVLRLQGLYLLDMSVAQPVAKMLDVGPMDPKTNFCEVKWCSATGRLLAATGMGATFELLECRV